MGTDVEIKRAEIVSFSAAPEKPADFVPARKQNIAPSSRAFQKARFPEEFLLEETGCGFQGRIEYNTDLFEANATNGFLQHLSISPAS
jgi:hypothetical protein